jgi:outer membrane immunogenic protein
MKAFLFSTAAALAMVGVVATASGADLARRPPPPPPTKAPVVVPAYNWTGFYMGINGGYGFGRSTWDGLPASFDVNGGMVGGQLGYNWQFGQFVYGLEGDGDWTHLRGTANFADCNAGCQTRNDFLATARGRLGIAADRWLPYVTGGLAVGDIKASVPDFATGIDKTNAGWTVGGGLEFALSGNWTAKAEYLYVDLGHAGCSVDCGLPTGNNVNLTTNVVRGGINYRF